MKTLASLLSVATLVAAGAVGAAERPNVVLIVVDDLGWADLGCQGSEIYETPHLDSLAANGMRFTQAYAACAVCSPTRVAIMTGRAPARVGITDWIRPRTQRGETPAQNPSEYVGGPRQALLCPPNPFWMELEEVTIAERLRESGYRTGFVGKWHLGDGEHGPGGQGFDENHGGCDYGQPPSYFDPFTDKKHPQGIPGLPGRDAGEYLTAREADEAATFIQRHAGSPFFLTVCHYGVHTPLQAIEERTAVYRAKIAATPLSKQRNAVYAAMVESVDQATGRIVDALERAGVRDSTLILFTSDNGGLLGSTDNSPLRSGKGYPYEGGLRVPLIANWPDAIPAATSDRPVISMDLLPTILAACDVDSPETALDGASLLAHLTSGGTAEIAERPLFWHFPHYRGDVTPYSVLREGDLKLIKRHEGPTLELYDLEFDPSERRDVSAERPDDVRRLDARLSAILRETGAKPPRPNPGFREVAAP